MFYLAAESLSLGRMVLGGLIVAFILGCILIDYLRGHL